MNASELIPSIEAMNLSTTDLGVVVVDHGSRVQRSNDLLNDVVAVFRAECGLPIVEPAHMELAEPSIKTAMDRCIEQGAKTVVVHPYFLLPGRHWQKDIPRLAAEAASGHPEIRYLVTAPLGIHKLMASIMADRIAGCLQSAAQQGPPCELCSDDEKCSFAANGSTDA